MDPLKDAPANLQPMVYKYFSELEDAQVDKFEMDAEPTQMAGTMERGNVLASSVIHLQPWATDSKVAAKGLQQKVILKLYDENRGSFKLNDTATLIGVLEYRAPTEPPGSQDSQMENFED